MGNPQTLILIALTVAVSWAAFSRPRLLDRLTLWPPAIDRKHEYDRLVTHGFVHADFTHLLFNMITLYFFGPMAERFYDNAVGPLAYPVFYLVAIVVAILPTYMKHRHDGSYRSLGASGAVSAVMFTYVLFDPWDKLYLFFALPIPAIVFAVAYLAYSAWADARGGHGNINHSAHFWGAAFGIASALVVEPQLVSIFMDRLLAPFS